MRLNFPRRGSACRGSARCARRPEPGDTHCRFHRLLADGHLRPGAMKDVLIHTVRDDETMVELSVATKLTPEPELIGHLKARGREAADTFLREHWEKLGEEGSLDLQAMFD